MRRMKSWVVVSLTVILAAVALSLLYAQQAGTGVSPALIVLFNEQELDRYRVDIQPVTPDSGISTGVVVAYGHPIPHPYVVTAESGRVVVNGVQVLPPLKTPAVRAFERRDSVAAEDSVQLAEENEFAVLLAEAQQAFDSAAGPSGLDQAAAWAVQVLARSPLVDSVRRSRYGCWVYRAGYANRIAVSFLWPVRGSSAVDPRLATSDSSAAAGVAEVLRSDLREDRVLMLAGSQMTIDRATFSDIGDLLRDAQLPDDERFQRLARLSTHAFWLMANYSVEEWDLVPGEER